MWQLRVEGGPCFTDELSAKVGGRAKREETPATTFPRVRWLRLQDHGFSRVFVCQRMSENRFENTKNPRKMR